MLVQKSMMHEKSKSCCEHEKMPQDCCYNEINFFTKDYSLNLNFSSVEFIDLSNFWVENFLYDISINEVLLAVSNKYSNAPEIPLTNEVGLYRYVQSFLI